VTARDEQQEIGKAEVGIDEARAERMALEMVDRDERLAGGQSDPLSSEQRDHDSADEAGSCC
jgi:hypothetical protein